MDKKINLNYTKDAEKRLESMKNDYVSKIEEAIIDRKYVPGERCIDVTVSDVETAATRITLLEPTSVFWDPFGRRYARNLNSLYWASKLYISLGFAAFLYGLFGSVIWEIYYDDPIRFWFLITGISMILAGVLIRQYYKNKEARYYKKVRDMHQHVIRDFSDECDDIYDRSKLP
jgi:hypothetical protein